MRLVPLALVVAVAVVACGGGAGTSLPGNRDADFVPGSRSNNGGTFGGASLTDGGQGTAGMGGQQGTGGAGGSPGADAGGTGGAVADGGTLPATDASTNPSPDAPRDTAVAPRDSAPPRPDTASPSPDTMAPPRPDAMPPMPDMGPADPCNDGTCAAFDTQYSAALTRARSCNPILKGQCLQMANGGLSCPLCQVWVNSTIELDDVRMRWTAAGCHKCRKVCPQVACLAPTSGVCDSRRLAAPPEDTAYFIIPPGGGTGTCVDSSMATP